jgi:hemolysin activation/secretion protein
VQFDRRDELGIGGITFGALTWTPGRLRLNPELAAADVNSTRGGFSKINLDLTRVQALSSSWSASARLLGQWAGQNLDSSEKMALGGPGAVRAYPSGEGNGDEAWVTQLELRRAGGALSPYAFIDMGRVRAVASPAAGQDNADRKLAGAGAGARYQAGRWSFDAALAWRTRGGKPESDGGRDERPRLWLSASGRF